MEGPVRVEIGSNTGVRGLSVGRKIRRRVVGRKGYDGFPKERFRPVSKVRRDYSSKVTEIERQSF